MSEQVEKIKKLIATATNPKQKAMYEQLLAKLQPEQDSKNVPETSPAQPPEPAAKKPKTIAVKPKSEPAEKQPKTVAPKPEGEATEKTAKTVAPKAQPEPTEEQPKTAAETAEKGSEPEKNPLFQAVGIIKGDVIFDENDQAVIKIKDKEYRLYYIPTNRRRKVHDALKKEIEATGNTTQRLIVYPKIIHFPDKEKIHSVAFQLVGFIAQGDKGNAETIDSELKDFEFCLRGLWQFIPVCRTPCISVFKNFNKDRLDWVKQAEAEKKVKFMKASHVPLLWKDSPVKPFRFNPKLEKEQQGKTYFVEVKARFLPDRDVFGFVEQLSEPSEEPPKFFKASKKLKAEALKSKAG